MSYLDRYTIERNEKIANKAKLRWQDPIFRDFMSTKQVSKAGSFLVRKKNSEAIIKLWKTEEYRQKQLNTRKNRDWSLTDKMKERISQKLMGRPSPRKDYKFTDAEKERASQASKLVWTRPEYRKYFQERFLGLRNPNWKGGSSFLPYSFVFNKKLKEEIKERDNFRCRYCDKIEEQAKNEDSLHRGLTVHHVDFDKNNNSKENLMTACRRCNAKLNFRKLILAI